MPLSNGSATVLSAASPTGVLGRETLKGLNSSGSLWGTRRLKAGPAAWKVVLVHEKAEWTFPGKQKVMNFEILHLVLQVSIGDHTDCSHEP